MSTQSFDSALAALTKHVESLLTRDRINTYTHVVIEPGRRYAKLLISDSSLQNRLSWGYVDTNGDILLPAGRKPAKHARGNIYDPSTWKNFSWTGPQYLR